LVELRNQFHRLAVVGGDIVLRLSLGKQPSLNSLQ
jgi:hypothetical protein